jgi:capsid portal protein
MVIFCVLWSKKNYEVNLRVIKSDSQSRQIIGDDMMQNSLIEPFFSFDALLDLFYANTYHRRAIMLKASLLSNVTDASSLEGQTKTPKQLLYSFILNLELFGNAFLEISGKKLYLLPTIEARVDRNHNIFQVKNGKKIELEAKQLAYYSPKSLFYGEPDYLGSLLSILTSSKIDGFNNAFFDNSAKADKAIVFENAEPNEEQMRAFEQFFGSNFKGYQNAHKTLIVTAHGENAKVRFEDLSRIDDLSFEKLKNMTRDEIITAHGVPPRMMGIVTAGALGGGGELIGQLHAFNQLTIIPKQEEIEWFFESIGFPIKLNPIDVTNFKDDSELVTNLINAGIISISEARAILGYTK